MVKTVEITLEPMSHDAFAPFGEIVGEWPTKPDWQRPLLDAWKMHFQIQGRTELRVMRYHYQGAPEFSLVERHLAVTESRVPMGGVKAIMVVGEPTRNGEGPERLRAFYLDGTVGLMLHKGVWHALDCFPARPPFADFAFITEVETEDEIETSKDPVHGKRTQLFDYKAERGVLFRVVDPDELLTV